jgi:DNA repair exonuclease SbcCD ATPase subunit
VRAEEARLAVEWRASRGTSRASPSGSRAVPGDAGHGAQERVASLDARRRPCGLDLAEARQRRRPRATKPPSGSSQERTQGRGRAAERDAALQRSPRRSRRPSAACARRARPSARPRTVVTPSSSSEQELGGRIERIRERLEGEWGRPLESLLAEAAPVEGEPEALQSASSPRSSTRSSAGPGEHARRRGARRGERAARVPHEQRDDLVEASNDLRSAIREINKTATDLFNGTFEQIRENFRTTFLRLFEGGEADIWLEDSEDPLESPIEIHASPRGKRTQRIDLFSGGERALTALSLLFGIYLVKPSPFCVLDEVDAPLDENNIGRFIRLLQDFKAQTQFVVITHNPRTIEAADWIYGVTMEEPGVSTIVGCEARRGARGRARCTASKRTACPGASSPTSRSRTTTRTTSETSPRCSSR